MNAPYTGGNSPGGQLFFNDGDWTQISPEGMPVLSFPFKGDSILTLNDILQFDLSNQTWATTPFGTYPNIHPWTPNQDVAVIDQDFVVAQSYYKPTPLNTPYDINYSLGFQATFSGTNNYPWGGNSNNPNQGFLYLVEEGELMDIGAGLSKFKRKYAILPPTRCETEQFAVTFPGISNQNGNRPPFTQDVLTRIQYDYFIFDDLDILTLPLFTGYDPDVSQLQPRLNKETGLYPAGLILPKFAVFLTASSGNSFQINYQTGQYIGNQTDTLLDGNNPTIPSATDYLNWAVGNNTSNGQPVEIVVEASTLTRWMGNIYERRTRFTQAI